MDEDLAGLILATIAQLQQSLRESRGSQLKHVIVPSMLRSGCTMRSEKSPGSSKTLHELSNLLRRHVRVPRSTSGSTLKLRLSWSALMLGTWWPANQCT